MVCGGITMKKTLYNVIIFILSFLLISTSVSANDYYRDSVNNTQQPYSKEYKQKFWDVDKSHWAFYAIAELNERGAISGYVDGSFKPENIVTRSEWAKIMIEAADLSANDYSVKFTDMNSHWAIAYVNAASDYLTAFSDNSYRPDQAVTREDVTVAMVKLKGYNLSEVDYSVLSRFSDVASISNSLKVYVAIAVEKGLINGFEDGTFRGQATLSRAEAATLLWRAFQFGSDNKTPASSGSANNTTYTPAQSESNFDINNQSPSTANTNLTVSNLDGQYSSNDIRAIMNIKKNNDTFKINMINSLSYKETIMRFFEAKIDKSSGKLTYSNGYEYLVIDNEDGTTSYILETEGCEGDFLFSNEYLIWNDYTQDLSGRAKFSKTTEVVEFDYASKYETATYNLNKYIESCMNVSFAEDSVSKARSLSTRYNVIKGLLLDCFGFGDSDELLLKLDSVHNIAIKMADSLRTHKPIDVQSITSSVSSMRDNSLVIKCDKFTNTPTNLNMKFNYDYSAFTAEVTKVFNRVLDRSFVEFVISLFADNYKDAEFKRLLREAYSEAGEDCPADFEMYYGGYNISIEVETHSYGYVNIKVTGEKGVKRNNNKTQNSSYKSDALNYDNSLANTGTEPNYTSPSNKTESTNSTSQEKKYHYICYYAEYVIDEHSSGKIMWHKPDENYIMGIIKEKNGTLTGKIELLEMFLSEYKGDFFDDEETGIRYYLER